MTSTSSQSQLCTATAISSFVLCQISFRLLPLFLYLNLSYNLCNLSICLISKRSSIGQSLIKIKRKMKWIVKLSKHEIYPFPSSHVHSFLSTTKHLEKIMLHMVFTFFVNILKTFFEQIKI